MPGTPKRKTKSGRKGGGLFGCRSKSALDSLPRNARGTGAAIHRLQAQQVFEDDRVKSSSCASPSSTASNNANPFELMTVKTQPPAFARDADDDDDEARDVLTDSVNPILNSSSPGTARANSISGASNKFRRSLSLKRSGSTATANLVQRAPPVSSTDFAPDTQLSGATSQPAEKEIGAGPVHREGDMASIRQARGQHLSASAAAASSQNLFPDISEDEYISLAEVPVPPSFIPIPSLPPVSHTAADTETPSKRVNKQCQRLAQSAMPESESMRAVALALGDDNSARSQDSMTYRFQPGPSIGTPRLEAGSPTTTASIAEVNSRRADHSSDFDSDELTPLPASAPAATGGFWDNQMDKEVCAGSSAHAKFVPFQYMTNLSRPVSIASFRSLASPYTPPRTSSRNAIENRPSFSPLASQGTFNGFPAGYFPKTSSGRPADNLSPKQEKETLADTSVEDVEAQLGLDGSSHNEFAQFAAKGKASRRTTMKKPNVGTAPLTDATNTGEPASGAPLSLSTAQKKMVPGPAGNYITDTANMRWCSALDEIKKALASTTDDDSDAELASCQPHNKFDKLENHIDELLEEADAVLTKLGVETYPGTA